MNSIDKEVRHLARLEKTLRGIRILVVARKDGTIKVKWGKKFDLLTVPSKEWGDEIKLEFDAVIKRKADLISRAMIIVRGGVEQMTLFGKEGIRGDQGQIMGEAGRERILDSVREDTPGRTEHTDAVPGGIDCGTGEQLGTGGAEEPATRISV